MRTVKFWNNFGVWGNILVSDNYEKEKTKTQMSVNSKEERTNERTGENECQNKMEENI